MQVTLDKQYPVAAPPEAAWRVLSNVTELATCMPGAQITEMVDDTHYKGSVKVKVGPATAAFAGTIEVLGVDAATRTLRMLGKGADKAGSSASMELTARVVAADGGASTLLGKAEVVVAGTPVDLAALLGTTVPVVRARYAFEQRGGARLDDAVGRFLETVSAAPSRS